MGIPFRTIPIHLLKLENLSPEYTAKNPMGQIPTLECIDTTTQTTIRIAQSVAIIEFLHESFPQCTSLFPTDPVDRAVARQLVEIVNSGTQPLQNFAVMNRLTEMMSDEAKAKDFGKGAMERGLAAFEELVKQHRASKGDAAGPFCVGSFSPTVADVCVVPQIHRARSFEVNVDAICPTLVAIDALCATHPWFALSHPSQQPDAPNC
jgi:maleylpyruvate isomerase